MLIKEVNFKIRKVKEVVHNVINLKGFHQTVKQNFFNYILTIRLESSLAGIIQHGDRVNDVIRFKSEL